MLYLYTNCYYLPSSWLYKECFYVLETVWIVYFGLNEHALFINGIFAGAKSPYKGGWPGQYKQNERWLFWSSQLKSLLGVKLGQSVTLAIVRLQSSQKLKFHNHSRLSSNSIFWCYHFFRAELDLTGSTWPKGYYSNYFVSHFTQLQDRRCSILRPLHQLRLGGSFGGWHIWPQWSKMALSQRFFVMPYSIVTSIPWEFCAKNMHKDLDKIKCEVRTYIHT